MKVTITLTALETIEAVRRYAEEVKRVPLPAETRGSVLTDVPTEDEACTVIYRERSGAPDA